VNRDPDSLRSHVRSLTARRRSGHLNAAGLAALAEACFRLGLDPHTPPDEALTLLRHAIACDEANPKFAYHLARRYMIHGDPNRAAVWLRRAIDQCPTSHRLWAHASLLQQELDEQYQGDDRFEPMALRRRGEALLKRIREGADCIDPALLNFEPPPARPPDAPAPTAADGPVTSPPRLRDPGRCRWSGVDDLEAEALLQEPPSRRVQDRLLPLLEAVKARGHLRRGGNGAFAVLAVSWLVMGHPVATIRRLLPAAEAGGPSDQLVDQVCQLYEADDQALPAAIADAVCHGRLPPLVAALIHHRRLLNRPIGYPEVGRAYQFACGLLADPATDEEASVRQAEELRRAAAALEPDPAGPAADTAEPPVDGDDPAARFTRLAENIDRLAGQLQAQTPRIRQLANEPARLGPDEQGEIGAARALLYELDHRCQSSLGEVAAVREAGVDDLTTEIGETTERLAAACQGAPARVAGIRRLLDRLQYVTTAATHGDEEPEVAAAASARPKTVLEEAVGRIDRELAERFAAAIGPLDGYPADVSAAPPMRALRAMVLAAQAETWYRLGHTVEARGLWAQTVRLDPLDPGLRKNLAVLATLARDGGVAMEAWGAYGEALYAQAILTGSVRTQAEERAALHRHLGGAYAPQALAVSPDSEPPEQDEQDGLTEAAFVGQCGAVGLFVRHKLLEWLNAKLDYSSPSLLLGIDRRHDEDTREEARTALLNLLWEAAPALPERFRLGFEFLATRTINTASVDCASAQGKVELDATYEREREQHLRWLRQVCQLKLRLEQMVITHLENRAGRCPKGFLDELVLLDRVPLAASSQFLEQVARDLHLKEPATLVDSFTTLRRSARG
jgi:hypothetical protein